MVDPTVSSLTFWPRPRRMHQATALVDKGWLQCETPLPDIRENRGCSKRDWAPRRDRIGSQCQATSLPCRPPSRDKAMAGAGAGCGLDKALRKPARPVFPFALSRMSGGGEDLQRNSNRIRVIVIDPAAVIPCQSRVVEQSHTDRPD